MRIKYTIILLFALLLLAPSQVFSGQAETAYQKARDSYYALQKSSRKQLYRENWMRVIDRFSAVYEGYADHSRGSDALYMLCKTADGLYRVSRLKSDAVQAIDYCQQMSDRYPQSRLSDDALMLAGNLQENVLHDPRAAYLTYARLTQDYPKSDMAGKAGQRLKALAKHAPLVTESKPPAKISPPTKAAPAPSKNTSKGTTRLTTVRFWSNPGYTRVVLDLSQAAEFSAHFLAGDKSRKESPRLYIDISPAELSDQLTKPTKVDDGLLSRIRTGTPDGQTVRVVLDLDSIGDYKVFPLEDPYRIVVDIAGEKVPELKRREPEIRSLPGSGTDDIAKVLGEIPRDQPKLHIPDAPVSTTLRRIVVDAGHGGKDPGAVGARGTLEKDITLVLAKKLAGRLRKQLGCEVILTRSGDVFLPLEERTAIANKVGADLFISLHANANNNRKAYGVETYYLNFSKNDKAAAVAARENGTSIKQVSDLELILFDLMANSKINESSRLAAEIQKGLVGGLSKRYDNIRDLGVRQGPFYVLLGATMPSVLVEAAFISNSREEKRLKSKDYQDRVADSIARSVKNYAIAHKLIASR
jgi:N-acetylmuramoyl-L-alanine amidase